ncbi:MAG: sialate O-acetylesterase [Planctomycetota bacterium]|nr:sialate O-acetylesterase [Planctomycetota bacterium]
MLNIIILLLAPLSPLQANVTLPKVFSDHMVLQQQMAVPIWGQAAANEEVTVEFRGQKKSAKADAEGKWRLTLEPLKAGGPDELKVTGQNAIVIKDVLVGEVWVGSGQSNMAGSAGGYAKNDAELAKVLASAPYEKLRILRQAGAWTDSSKANLSRFSALLLSFGHRVQVELDVPVGLIAGAIGGTPSGSWVSPKRYAEDENCKKVIAKYAETFNEEALKKRYEVQLAKWEKAVARLKEQGKKRLPRKPRMPVKPGEHMRGSQIGGLYNKFIQPVAGYGIKGVLWDQGESGTAILGLDQFTAMGSLISGWREDWGQDFPFLYIQKPSGGGCAWDTSNPVTQKANKFTAVPAKHSDGKYRELHIRIRQHPKTWMASVSDLGSGVHPTNKWGYGQRAAQVAMGAVYEKSVAIYGPTYASHTTEGNKVRIKFENTGQGLAFKNGDKLQGFAVAGADKVFHWADAEMEGADVVVSSEKVTQPMAIRYGWSRSHPWANLFNKDGLPALTFRTDSW